MVLSVENPMFACFTLHPNYHSVLSRGMAGCFNLTTFLETAVGMS